MLFLISRSRCMEGGFLWPRWLFRVPGQNFWGLGCPFYCGALPLSGFLGTFLLGWIFGLASSALAWIYLCHLLPSQPASFSDPSSPHTANQRLASYLHERGLIPRRRRWDHHQDPGSGGHCFRSSFTGSSLCGRGYSWCWGFYKVFITRSEITGFLYSGWIFPSTFTCGGTRDQAGDWAFF